MIIDNLLHDLKVNNNSKEINEEQNLKSQQKQKKGIGDI